MNEQDYVHHLEEKVGRLEQENRELRDELSCLSGLLDEYEEYVYDQAYGIEFYD